MNSNIFILYIYLFHIYSFIFKLGLCIYRGVRYLQVHQPPLCVYLSTNNTHLFVWVSFKRKGNPPAFFTLPLINPFTFFFLHDPNFYLICDLSSNPSTNSIIIQTNYEKRKGVIRQN